MNRSTAWYQEHGAGVQTGGIGGRSFYSSLGHLNETWMVCPTNKLIDIALHKNIQKIKLTTPTG